MSTSGCQAAYPSIPGATRESGLINHFLENLGAADNFIGDI
jgi:hypothetical protein